MRELVTQLLSVLFISVMNAAFILFVILVVAGPVYATFLLGETLGLEPLLTILLMVMVPTACGMAVFGLFKLWLSSRDKP